MNYREQCRQHAEWLRPVAKAQQSKEGIVVHNKLRELAEYQKHLTPKAMRMLGYARYRRKLYGGYIWVAPAFVRKYQQDLDDQKREARDRAAKRRTEEAATRKAKRRARRKAKPARGPYACCDRTMAIGRAPSRGTTTNFVFWCRKCGKTKALKVGTPEHELFGSIRATSAGGPSLSVADAPW